jgi:hypothetical protein
VNTKLFSKVKKILAHYLLSFSVDGRISTVVIKKHDFAEARQRIGRDQQFKELCFLKITENLNKNQVIKAAVKYAHGKLSPSSPFFAGIPFIPTL